MSGPYARPDAAPVVPDAVCQAGCCSPVCRYALHRPCCGECVDLAECETDATSDADVLREVGMDEAADDLDEHLGGTI